MYRAGAAEKKPGNSTATSATQDCISGRPPPNQCHGAQPEHTPSSYIYTDRQLTGDIPVRRRLRTRQGTRTDGQCPNLRLAPFTEPLPDNDIPGFTADRFDRNR